MPFTDVAEPHDKSVASFSKQGEMIGKKKGRKPKEGSCKGDAKETDKQKAESKPKGSRKRESNTETGASKPPPKRRRATKSKACPATDEKKAPKERHCNMSPYEFPGFIKL